MDLGDHPENLERIERRINFYLAALERILGAPAGSVERVDRQFIQRFAQIALKPNRGEREEEWEP